MRWTKAQQRHRDQSRRALFALSEPSDRLRVPLEQQRFTLVELLVVIAIIAVLASMLLPSLSLARQRARDAVCAGIMRQGLLAVLTYNNDFSTGLANYRPNCPFWGKGWEGFGGGAHGLYAAPDEGSYGHIWREGRSWMTFWRQYLLAGEYADSKTLGCPARNYVGAPYDYEYRASYNGFSASNEIETDGNANTFRRNPSFVWFGPGTYDTNNVNEYAGGNLAVPGWGQTGGTTYTISYLSDGPLMTCPQVWLSYRNNTKFFEPAHRPQWRTEKNGSLKPLPYAANVGYTDGRVRFFFNAAGGTYNPMR